MPVNEKMMMKLKKQYGKDKGKSIYYAMEMKKKAIHKMPSGKMMMDKDMKKKGAK